jgi:hypothetical protein
MSFQPRKVRSSWFPHGYGVRLVAMLGALVLVGATIYNLRNRAIAARGPGANAARAHEAALAENPEKSRWTETVIEGPADESPLEQEEIKRFFEVVTDKQAIGDTDMPAFWRLLKWSRSRSFAELEQRAQRDLPFAKYWQEPEKHRGELIRLPLHVRQIVKWDDISENPAGVTTTYDLSGGNQESRGYPYVVVCSELPPEIKVATRTDVDVVFVGYFLKIIKYDAFGGKGGAPVLIGRVRTVPNGAHVASARSAGLNALLVIGGAVIVAVIILVAVYRVTRQSPRIPWKPGPPALSNDNIESWLENIPAEGAGPADTAETIAPRFSTALATNGQAHHSASPESNGHAGE